MSTWNKVKLGDVVTFQRGHDLPKTEFVTGKYPIAGSNGIIGYHNTFTTKGPGITVGRSGNLGTPFYYEKDFWAHNTTLYVKEFHNSHPKFVFYFLKTLDLAGHNSGSAVPSLNRNFIHPIEVIIPDLPTQSRIAAILSVFDDKIELNRQMNHTLEQMAKALFKKYFVDDVDSDNLPIGWRINKLGNVIEIKYGKDHKHLEDGKIPVYGSGGIMRYVNQALYDGESILIPRKGTLSNLFYLKKPFWSVDTMFYTKIKNEFYGLYLFHLFKSMNFAEMDVGSAVPSLTTEVLNNLEVVIPSKDLLKMFDDLVAPMFVRIDYNIEESKTLASLRDNLLPKLMSGEINLEQVPTTA